MKKKNTQTLFKGLVFADLFLERSGKGYEFKILSGCLKLLHKL